MSVEVETDVEHDDLWDTPGAEDDGEDDDPSTMVIASVTMPDGMRFAGTVSIDGESASPRQVAVALLRSALGCAAVHSPTTLAELKQMCAHPNEVGR